MPNPDHPPWVPALYDSLPLDEEVTVPVTVHAGLDAPGAAIVAARIRGIVGALRPTSSAPGQDPLAAVDTDSLCVLLSNLARVGKVLDEAQDRVVGLLAGRKVSLRVIGRQMDVHHQTVANRLRRSARTDLHGLGTYTRYTTLTDLVVEFLGDREDYDVPAIVDAYRNALNQHLDSVGIVLLDDHFYADPPAPKDAREHIFRAFAMVDLTPIATRYHSSTL